MQAMIELGFTPEQVREAIIAESVYQAVCQSAPRDPANTEPVVAIVPDLACAEFIAERLSATCRATISSRRGGSGSTRQNSSKDNAASIFYLPCRRAGHEADHWIEHHDGEPMDVVEWLGMAWPGHVARRPR